MHEHNASEVLTTPGLAHYRVAIDALVASHPPGNRTSLRPTRLTCGMLGPYTPAPDSALLWSATDTSVTVMGCVVVCLRSTEVPGMPQGVAPRLGVHAHPMWSLAHLVNDLKCEQL